MTNRTLLFLLGTAFLLHASEPYPHSAEFRIAGSKMLPQVESAQQVVFSDTVSGIPAGGAIDRITAPPWSVVVDQRIAVRDLGSGEDLAQAAAVESTWEPGMRRAVWNATGLEWTVEQIALYQPQGFLLRFNIQNLSGRPRRVLLSSTQQPSIHRPTEWNWDPTFRRDRPAACRAQGGSAVHENAEGAIALAMEGAIAECNAQASRIERQLRIPAGGKTTIGLILAVAARGEEAAAGGQQALRDVEATAEAARQRMDRSIEQWFRGVPALTHPDPRVVRFYRYAAAQLLWTRWRLGKALVLDPWYATSGRDSGALNAYAWELQYAALAMSLLDPAALRAQLVAMPAAPLSEHFSIEPLKGAGLGPFYSYSSYSYTAAVDEYLRRTGDTTLLHERSGGKSVLEWLVELAQWGESDRDGDGNGLLDCGNDKNILELKKTGDGPGYINEVPSPNGERAWVYDTVARYLEHADAQGYRETIERFRVRAARVRRALNEVLWLESPGWYGARQRDGKVVPVYTIQIFDLLRFPGLVPAERAQRIVTHLNREEFLAPWGVRSMSIRDRLFDYLDHDWAGPMSYMGETPQLIADLYRAGFDAEAAGALERILWWPEHLSVYPQGIANDDYSSRFPESKAFGGRIAAGRSNVIAGCTGMDAIIRGLFGVEPAEDGSLEVTWHHVASDGAYSLAYPFRGHTWSVTQDRQGMTLAIEGGMQVDVRRKGVTLRVAPAGSEVRIRARARAQGTGLLEVQVPGQAARRYEFNGGELDLRIPAAR